MDILLLLQDHGYLTLFGGLLLEYLGAPIPGELILVFFGAFVYLGKLNLWFMLATGFAAVIIGDHFWYWMTRRGGRRWLRWFCRATLGSAQCEARTQRFFQRYGPASLLLAKFLPGFRTFAMPMAGMTGVPYARFLFYESVGSLLWLVATTELGMLMAPRVGVAVARLHYLGGGLLLIIALVTLSVLVLRLRKRSRHGAPMVESEPPAR
jgi:membrane protein DedA with SNARE-associated domain